MKDLRDAENQGAPAKEADPIADLLRTLGPRPPIPEDVLQRSRELAWQEWQRELAAARRRRTVLWSALAAALLGGVGLALWMASSLAKTPTPLGSALAEDVVARTEQTQGRPSRVTAAGTREYLEIQDELAPGDWIETDGASRVALRLAGGSSLRVDVDTRVSLRADERLLLERGALYVDAPPDAAGEKPLEILTPFGKARDIGTQFEVRLEQHGLRLRVREGLVDLEVAGDGQKHLHRVEAGHELALDARGEMAAQAVAAHDTVWQWSQEIAPPFALDGKNLDDFLGWLARETGWEVVFHDPELARAASAMVLHGSLEGLRPDQTPDVVLETCGLSHHLQNGKLKIDRLP